MKAYLIEMTRDEDVYYRKYSTNLKVLLKEYYKQKRHIMSCSPNYVEESRHFKGGLAPYFSLEAQVHDTVYKLHISDIEICEE